ncbi:MAG: tetratricopeptide repeat protein [Anaerolineaceae bacterium]|nr:tetratricopeptide repeat protein [Anaerolineaceae bacterium]
MFIENSLTEFKNIFSEFEATQVMQAVMQDPLVLKSLGNVKFFHQAVDKLGNDLAGWTPAELSLLALSDKFELIGVMTEGTKLSNTILSQSSTEKLNNTLNNQESPEHITDVGLLAAALLSRYQLNPSWMDLWKEIEFSDNGIDWKFYEVWRTPLACLYGWVEEPLELLKSLNRKSQHFASYYLISHILLCNVIEKEKQTALLKELMDELEEMDQIYLLRAIHFSGRADLVASFANSIKAGSEKRFIGDKYSPERSISFDKMKNILVGAYANILAGENASGIELLEQAVEYFQNILLGIKLQIIEQEIQDEKDTGNLEESGKTSRLLFEYGENINTELLTAFFGNPRLENILKSIEYDPKNPFVSFHKAKLLFDDGRIPEAKSTAATAVKDFINLSLDTCMSFLPNYGFTWKPEEMIELLRKLDMRQDAILMTEFLLAKFPMQSRLMEILSSLYFVNGNHAKALEIILPYLILEPNDAAGLELGAKIWKHYGKDEKAYSLYQRYLRVKAEPTDLDWFEYAKYSERVCDYKGVLEASEEVLKRSVHHAEANIMQGIAALKLGEIQLAITSLSMGTLLSPESIEAWFYLADAHRKNGDDEKALDVLQSGVNHIPNSSKLNLALAEAYFTYDLISDGLNYLKNAIDCEQDSVATVIELGVVLRSMQMIEEEKSLYLKAQSKWPNDKYLASAHAELLISIHDFENAQRIMDNIINNGVPEINELLLCIKAMLKNRSPILSDNQRITGEVLGKAKRLVENALILEPENIEALLLNAEILAVSGELNSSSKIFKELLELPQSNKSEFYWRIQAGFGYIALQQEDVEIAIASLREAVNEQSDDTYLNRLLAEAYAQAYLKDEALHVAMNVVDKAPDDIDNLLWFAEIALRLGNLKIAQETLMTTTKLCPNKNDFLLRLADMQTQAGLIKDATHSLNVILQRKDQDYDELLHMGLLLMKLENYDEAENSLERAISYDQDESIDLLMMLSVLSLMKSDLESAFEYSQRSLALIDDPLLYFYQSDLLMAMNKPKSTFTCLKYALDHHKDKKDGSSKGNLDILYQILPSVWFEYVTPGGIFLRLANASWKSGQLAEGLGFARQALDLMPEDNVARFIVTCFAWMLGEIDLVRTFLGSSISPETQDKSFEFKRKSEKSLIAFQVDLAFEDEDEDRINNWISQLEMMDSSSSRYLAAKSRKFAKEGDVIKAEEFFRKASDEYQNEKETGTQNNGFTLGYDIVSDLCDSLGEWLAKAALDSFNWQNALDKFEELVNNNPAAARYEFEYAKALVICAEKQRLFSEFEIIKHAPGDWILDNKNYQRFLETMSRVAQVSDENEIKRWQMRGEMAFHLNKIVVKAFGNLAKLPEDLPILLTALRQIDNSKTAKEILGRINNPRIEPLLMALCYRESDLVKSIELAQKAIEERPKDPISYIILGDLTKRIDDTFIALQSYSVALKIWDDEPAWHAAAGELANKAGYFVDMMHFLEKAYLLCPENIDYALSLGKAYLGQKKFDLAIGVLRKAAERNPEKVDIWLVLADALAKDGQLESAFDCADRAKNANGKSPQPLLLLGELSAQIREYEAAIGYAQKALALEPDNEETVIFLSRILAEKGDIQKALGITEQYISRIGKSIGILIERARLRKIDMNPSGAIAILNDVLEREPDNIRALVMLSELLTDCGDLTNAEKCAQKALKAQPENAIINRILGKIKRDMGHLDQAIHYYSESIRKDPDVMDSYLDIAQTYQSRREKKEALDAYKKAIDVFPNDYRPYYSAGLLLRGEKDYIDAEKMLRKAVELSPNDISIQRQLGSVVALNLVHNAREANFRI